MKISEDYSFDVVETENGVTITLVQDKTGLTKRFFQAGTFNAMGMAGFSSHMLSLTDSQCEQWFNAAQRPKKTKEKK